MIKKLTLASLFTAALVSCKPIDFYYRIDHGPYVCSPSGAGQTSVCSKRTHGESK